MTGNRPEGHILTFKNFEKSKLITCKLHRLYIFYT